MSISFVYSSANHGTTVEYLNEIAKRIEHIAQKETQQTLFLFHTKCTEGDTCQNEQCISLHPGQHGYATGFVKRISDLCPHKKCPKKCGGDEGYCPYQHCDHLNANMQQVKQLQQVQYVQQVQHLDGTYCGKVLDGTYCGKVQCTGHCNVCGLATEEEQKQVRLRAWREWGENR